MLGKFEWEVLQYMTSAEMARWIAYLKLESEHTKAEAKRNKSKAGPARKRRRVATT